MGKRNGNGKGKGGERRGRCAEGKEWGYEGKRIRKWEMIGKKRKGIRLSN